MTIVHDELGNGIRGDCILEITIHTTILSNLVRDDQSRRIEVDTLRFPAKRPHRKTLRLFVYISMIILIQHTVSTVTDISIVLSYNILNSAKYVDKLLLQQGPSL